MSPRQWRKQGYMTIFFRDGETYLYKPSTGDLYRQPFGMVMWEGERDLHKWEQIKDADLNAFDEIAAVCYCDQGVDTCDFCTGLRTPECA